MRRSWRIPAALTGFSALIHLLRASSCCSHCSAGHIMPKPVQGPWDRLELGWRNPNFSTSWSLLHSWYVSKSFWKFYRTLEAWHLELQMEALNVCIYAYRHADWFCYFGPEREGADRKFKRIFAEATKTTSWRKFWTGAAKGEQASDALKQHSSNNSRILSSLSL